MDIGKEDKPFVLRLDSLEGLKGQSDSDDDSSSEEKEESKSSELIELQEAIENEKHHPTLEDVKTRLGDVHNVSKHRMKITGVFRGSDCFEYTVENLSAREKTLVLNKDTNGRLRRQFSAFFGNSLHFF